MALIPSLVKSVTAALKGVGETIARASRQLVHTAFTAKSRRAGATVTDIVDSIHHADPESIADKIGQTVKTVSRLVDTEPTIVAYPWDAPIRRNLIVSGRIKAARRYRVFYQADPVIDGAVTGARQWYSFYTDELKTFGEYSGDIAEYINSNRSSDTFELRNITFHHVVHKRGARWT